MSDFIIMEDLIIFNSLNFFSLIILFVIFAHTNLYFLKSKSGYISFWEKTIFYLILCVIFDILCWFVDGVPGLFFYWAGHIANILLFTITTMFTTYIALFLRKSAQFSLNNEEKHMKYGWIIVGINFFLCIFSIPFGFIYKIDPATNLYSRSGLYVIMIIVLIFPLLYEFFELRYKYQLGRANLLPKNRPLFYLLTIDMLLSMVFLILQGFGYLKISLLFPVNTLGILVLHLMIITNTISKDYLSGMQNRMGLEKFLAQFPKTINKYFSVIYMDINNFKSINDQFGHSVGDLAIKDFANILLNEIRYRDFAARVGGDEFVIIKISERKTDAEKTINAISNSINTFNSSKTRPYTLSFSHGISIAEPNIMFNKQELIDNADKLMYQNKKITKK